MKRKIIAIIVVMLLLVSTLPIFAFAVSDEDIVILYENDVHCAVEGYSKLAALKNELKDTYSYVGVVSGGDYIQGTSLGIVSKGEYLINLMNLVGYDAVALGNHEFDTKQADFFHPQYHYHQQILLNRHLYQIKFSSCYLSDREYH